MTSPAAHDEDHGACENCATSLQGDFCHHCGQRAHNPLQSFGHALEEVAESFWHLDGRVFRTLRDLLVPGRLIRAYVGGHRIAYIPPLRLFLVCGVLAFFVAQYAIHVNVNAAGGETFDKDASAAAVIKHRDEALQQLEAANGEVNRQAPGIAKSVSTTSLQVAEKNIRDAANERLAELGDVATASAPASVVAKSVQLTTSDHVRALHANEPGLQGRLHRWLDDKAHVVNAEEKLHPGAFVHEFLHALPETMVVLTPLFALLLWLFYWRGKHHYLEHLVVTLYSQSFLFLGMLAVFLLMLLGEYTPSLSSALQWLQILLWLWMAAYLWITQYRVYAQGIATTTLKYAALGSLYLLMLGFASLALAFVVVVNE